MEAIRWVSSATHSSQYRTLKIDKGQRKYIQPRGYTYRNTFKFIKLQIHFIGENSFCEGV